MSAYLDEVDEYVKRENEDLFARLNSDAVITEAHRYLSIHDLDAEEQYHNMRKKYKLRTKYNLRTAKSVIDAVESGKIRIEDTDFPYGSFSAFKEFVSKIDYDGDEFGTKEPSMFSTMTEREKLAWIESGHHGYSFNWISNYLGETFEDYRNDVLNGVYDD